MKRLSPLARRTLGMVAKGRVRRLDQLDVKMSNAVEELKREGFIRVLKGEIVLTLAGALALETWRPRGRPVLIGIGKDTVEIVGYSREAIRELRDKGMEVVKAYIPISRVKKTRRVDFKRRIHRIEALLKKGDTRSLLLARTYLARLLLDIAKVRPEVKERVDSLLKELKRKGYRGIPRVLRKCRDLVESL